MADKILISKELLKELIDMGQSLVLEIGGCDDGDGMRCYHENFVLAKARQRLLEG